MVNFYKMATKGRKLKVRRNKNKMSEKRGLYYPDGSFQSQSQIRRRVDYKDVGFDTPLPTDKPFSYWSTRFDRRSAEMQDAKERTQSAEVTFHDTTLLNFIGDIHAGSADTDYKRVEDELTAIVRTPNSYCVLMGDAIDGFFFNPAQMNAAEQVPEQVEYYHSMLRYLGDHKKLIAGWGGDHDGWAAKMGVSANARFARETGAYYMNGVGFVTAHLPNIDYRIMGAHRLPGFSMVNNAHPPMRAAKETQGADIVVSGHTHQKAVTQQPQKMFGGHARVITYLSVGPYKRTDDYSQKLGFADQPSEALYGASVILSKDRKYVAPYYDILEAHRTFTK